MKFGIRISWKETLYFSIIRGLFPNSYPKTRKLYFLRNAVTSDFRLLTSHGGFYVTKKDKNCGSKGA